MSYVTRMWRRLARTQYVVPPGAGVGGGSGGGGGPPPTDYTATFLSMGQY